MRDRPSLDGQILISIPQGSTIEYLGGIATDNRGVDWYFVRYCGLDGWTSSKYTQLD